MLAVLSAPAPLSPPSSRGLFLNSIDKKQSYCSDAMTDAFERITLIVSLVSTRFGG